MLGANPFNASARIRDASVLKIPKASLSDFPLGSRIIVRNLPYSTSEATLQKEFSNFGHVVEVKLVKDEKTNRSRGFGFIQFSTQEAAVLAMEQMDTQHLEGRMVYVELAKPKRDQSGYPRTSGPPPPKEDRLKK